MAARGEKSVNTAEELARNDPPEAPKPVQIKLPDGYPNGPVVVSSGGLPPREYLVKSGELVVDEDHAASVIAAIHGSSIVPAPLPAEQNAGGPAKEK